MCLYTHIQNNISNDATIKNGGAMGENHGLRRSNFSTEWNKTFSFVTVLANALDCLAHPEKIRDLKLLTALQMYLLLIAFSSSILLHLKILEL